MNNEDKKISYGLRQNSQEIFSIALGLEEPWQISSVSIGKEAIRLDIHLSFIKGHKFRGTDDAFCTAYDTVERSWQHLNFFQNRE